MFRVKQIHTELVKGLFGLFLITNTLVAQNQVATVVQNTESLLKEYDFVFAVIKYGGGGDWYEGKVGVIELMKFVNEQDIFRAYPFPVEIEPDAYNIFDYPFIYMTGHGEVVFSKNEVNKIKDYLERGGFLYANDDYGMDSSLRREVKKIFPYAEWVKLPLSHEIFSLHFRFPNGVPKIHKHDGGSPEIYAIFLNGKIAVLYTKNTDIGDGWAPYQVHKNPPKIREQALKFGFNIILYSFLK